MGTIEGAADEAVRALLDEVERLRTSTYEDWDRLIEREIDLRLILNYPDRGFDGDEEGA